jgi:tetratricopeptide (TPR) repeat protein
MAHVVTKPDIVIQAVQSHREEGNLDAAERALCDSLKIHPDEFWHLLELGVLLTERERSDEALLYLDRASKSVPADGRGALALALACKAAGSQERFREILRAASESDDLTCRSFAYLERGLDAIARGENDEGAEHLIRALEADPELAETPGRLEYIKLSPECLRRCQERLKQTVERGYGSKNVYSSLASLALQAGETGESTSWVQRAAETISVKVPRRYRNPRAMTPRLSLSVR